MHKLRSLTCEDPGHYGVVPAGEIPGILRDAGLEQCRGCYTCFERGEEYCPIKYNAPILEQKILDADGVILATPVYGFQVSGLMKVFIDRRSYISHRPRFFRQKALILTSAGAVGTGDMLKYLDMAARIWGFDVTARVGIVSHLPQPIRHPIRLPEGAISGHFGA